jgi:hypothetical protein
MTTLLVSIFCVNQKGRFIGLTVSDNGQLVPMHLGRYIMGKQVVGDRNKSYPSKA